MDFDRKHKRNIQKYIKEVEAIFNKLIAQTSSVVLRAKLQDELFKFKKHPKIKKDINLILNEFYNALLSSINVGTTNEWQLANEKIDALKTLQLKQVEGKISHNILALELSKIARSPRNIEALQSFQQRKINGFTISDRVWKITEQMRDELELAIDVSLAEGKSANQLAREIKKHLNNPDGLYRRVRDKHGNLVLSKNAKNFHPGRGGIAPVIKTPCDWQRRKSIPLIVRVSSCVFCKTTMWWAWKYIYRPRTRFMIFAMN